MTGVEPDRAAREARLRSALAIEALSRYDTFLLMFILGIAAILRFWHITQPLVDAFSWRQASTAMMSDNFRTGGWNIFFPEVSWTGPGPSYQGREFQIHSYLAAILHAVFGWQPMLGRLLAVIFGLVTIFALHRLTALVWSERHAHAAAICYALMPAAIMIDTSYLPEPSMLALVTLGIWLFVRYWLTGRTSLLVFAGLSFTLGALSKLPGLASGLVIVFLTLVLIVRGERARPLHIGIAIIAGLVPIIGWYAWAIYLGTNYPPFHIAGSGYIFDLGFVEFFNKDFYLPSLWKIAVWWFYGYAFLALFGIGIWLMPTDGSVGNDKVLRWIPLIWLGAGIILYLLAAKEITSNAWNLHLLHIPIAMFCGNGFLKLVGPLGGTSQTRFRGYIRIGFTMSAMLFLATGPLVSRMKSPVAEDAVAIGQFLDGIRSPDDLVIAVAPEVGDPIAVYYSRARGWVYPPGGGQYDWSTFGEDGPEAIAIFEELRANGARWFGLTKNSRDRKNRLFTEHHVELLAHIDATSIKVADNDIFLVYDLRSPGATNPDP